MDGQHKTRSVYHPDIALFLVLIPIISAINYYLTYSNIKLGWFLALTYTIDTLQGYLAWYAVRKLILYLDIKMPYAKNFLRRIAVQVASTTILGLAIIIVTTEMLSYAVKGEWAYLSFYTIDVVIIGIWFFFINAVYLGLYYYNTLKRTEIEIESEKKLMEDGFLVRLGQKDLKLDFKSILGFSAEGNLTIVHSHEGHTYYTDDSLKKIEDTLPTTHFFRLNRKFIVNRNLISGFKRIENGKILVLLHQTDLFNEDIIVSRTKAPQFKS